VVIEFTVVSFAKNLSEKNMNQKKVLLNEEEFMVKHCFDEKPLTAKELNQLKKIVLQSCSDLELMAEILRRQQKGYQVNLKKLKGGKDD
jgi:hypothetical protein